MISIVDYGVGNIFSLKSSLAWLGYEAELTSDPTRLLKAERIILPGVGAFGDAMEKLHVFGLSDAICEAAGRGVPLLGICLGMQLLFDRSFEYGEHAGLGLIPGNIELIQVSDPKRFKLPQMGWNTLSLLRKHPLLETVREGDSVYFVHSYAARDCDPAVLAVTDYDGAVTAAVARENVMGTQFHPEKSGRVGLGILNSFCSL